MHIGVTLVFLIFAAFLGITEVYTQELKFPKEVERCFYLAEKCYDKDTPKSNTLKQICHDLFKKHENGVQISIYDIRMIKTLLLSVKHNSHRRNKRDSKECKRRRLRKEVRRLTRREWRKFTRAVNSLKQKGHYDRLAAIHRGFSNIISIYGGPNFLGWHRIYLILFEEYLRREVPCVTIPYWDSSLDFEMEDPTMSVLWTKEFFGDGNGSVKIGPFSNWVTGQGDVLIRNIGSMGSLISRKFVRKVLTRKHHSEITNGSDPQYSIETYSNGVNVWVGGHMTLIESTAEDPVFFLHHAFIDCWWQSFRDKISKKYGRNPYHDYPKVTGPHSPTQLMSPFSNMTMFDGITNQDGYNEAWASVYKCQRFPSCSRRRQGRCRSKHLYCDRRPWRCVSREMTPAEAEREVELSYTRPSLPAGEKFVAIFKDNRTKTTPLQQVSPVNIQTTEFTEAVVSSSTTPSVGQLFINPGRRFVSLFVDNRTRGDPLPQRSLTRRTPLTQLSSDSNVPQPPVKGILPPQMSNTIQKPSTSQDTVKQSAQSTVRIDTSVNNDSSPWKGDIPSNSSSNAEPQPNKDKLSNSSSNMILNPGKKFTVPSFMVDKRTRNDSLPQASEKETSKDSSDTQKTNKTTERTENGSKANDNDTENHSTSNPFTRQDKWGENIHRIKRSNFPFFYFSKRALLSCDDFWNLMMVAYVEN